MDQQKPSTLSLYRLWAWYCFVLLKPLTRKGKVMADLESVTNIVGTLITSRKGLGI